ncbi:hypothetical protein A2U01_0101706, partial [Trifolium medium]|nr:hypothetical protein [Trifolium medium]
QPSSSQTAPAATSSAAPSLWDPMFNPNGIHREGVKYGGGCVPFCRCFY